MKITPTSRGIWSISLPIILSGLSETIIKVTDTVFLARYGITELGAVALAETLYGIAVVLLLGLVEGIQIITARRAGQDRPEDIGAVFNQGVYLLLLASVGLAFAMTFVAPLLTALVISSEPVRLAVDSYLKIIVFGIPFFAVNFAYSAVYISISRTRVLFMGTALLAVTNIILDYGLIFGSLGLPRLGIEGAALASVIAEVGACVFFTCYTLNDLDMKKYGLLLFKKWNTPLTKLLVSISSPVALKALLEAVRWFVFFAIIEQLGEVALAGSNIIYSFYALLIIPLDGFSETTCSMVSNLIGQRQSTRIPVLIKRAMVLSYLVTAVFLTIGLLFPEVILFAFAADSQAIQGCIDGLRVVAVAMLFIIPGKLLATVILGAGDTLMTFGLELVFTVCMLLWASGAALSLQLPLAYIWTSLLIGWLGSLALSYTWLRGEYWKRLSI